MAKIPGVDESPLLHFWKKSQDEKQPNSLKIYCVPGFDAEGIKYNIYSNLGSRYYWPSVRDYQDSTEPMRSMRIQT